MSWVIQAVAVAAAVLCAIAVVESALVDVGEITQVYVSAPLFDTRVGDDNGCDPVGCIGKHTRDGDRTAATSRWSCKPDLGPAGSTCTITYNLDAPLPLKKLRVALHEGDTRQRTLEVYVGGRLVTTWTSSGSTTDFETIDLPSRSTQTLELRGVQSSSEWLSISEVEILVEDDSVVEAGTLGTVATTASFYDTRLESDGGCDPAGCEASLTRDNDPDENSRWSCAPSLGGECSITYDLGATYDLYEIQLFLYGGSERTRTVEIFVDGDLSTIWTSSGTIDGFETINMSDFSGQVLEIRGDLPDSNTWLSIIETRIMVLPDQFEPPSPTPESPSPTPESPSPTPDTGVPVTRTTSDMRLIVEAGELDWVSAGHESHLYDRRIAVEGGCDPAGCITDYTRDGLLDGDKRWSCQFTPASTSDSDPSYYQCHVSYYLTEPQEIYGIRVALHKGNERTRELELWIDDVRWVTGWTSSGTTTDFEEILMPTSGIVGEVVTVRAVLDEGEWISITEVAIDVVVDGVPILGVSAAERVAVTATSDVGDPSVLLDGSYGPGEDSWTCTGDACSVTFDLQTIQNIVQLSLTFVEDSIIAADIFDVWVAYSETRGYTKVLSDVPSNKERALTPQQFMLVARARFVRITPSALGSGLLNIAEVDIRISEDAPIHPVATDPSLVSAGLLPKAEGDEGDRRTEEEGGCGTRGCTLINVKDGDMSTFWRCYGNPDEVECSAYYRLAYSRRLKQIRIALADGAERVSEIMFEGASSTERLSVLSSGETDGFETYNFDVTTSFVTISARFRSVMEVISISEIEFLVEEEPEGEIQTTQSSTWFQYFDDTTTDGEVVPQLFRRYTFIFYATVSAIELEIPTGQQHEFDVLVYDAKEEYEDGLLHEGFVTEDVEGFQTFTLDGIPDDLVVSSILILTPGTVENGDGFDLLGSRIIGEYAPNPTGEYLVASVAIEEWRGPRYPDFVGDGIADQEAIMGAICAVKEAEFDGVKCVGVNPDATGEVSFLLGEYYVNGNIFVESGVFLDGRFSIDDSPYTTDIILTEGAAGNTDVPAMIVVDGIENTRLDSLFVYGNYDAETDSGVSATPGLGSKGFEFTNCKNVTVRYIQSRNMDGDGITVTDSELVSIDAGPFDEEYLPWRIIDNRGTGLLIQNSESVWIRRHTLYDNGVAGLVIKDSKNVTFEATYDTFASTGEGNVGSLDGLQPLDVSVEGSTMVKFDHMRVTSSNEPAITVSADSSDVSFFECGFDSIASGACVIEAADPSVVNVTDSGGELVLEGICFEKV